MLSIKCSHLAQFHVRILLHPPLKSNFILICPSEHWKANQCPLRRNRSYVVTRWAIASSSMVSVQPGCCGVSSFIRTEREVENSTKDFSLILIGFAKSWVANFTVHSVTSHHEETLSVSIEEIRFAHFERETVVCLFFLLRVGLVGYSCLNVFNGLFPGWKYKYNPTDLRNIPLACRLINVLPWCQVQGSMKSVWFFFFN